MCCLALSGAAESSFNATPRVIYKIYTHIWGEVRCEVRDTGGTEFRVPHLFFHPTWNLELCYLRHLDPKQIHNFVALPRRSCKQLQALDILRPGWTRPTSPALPARVRSGQGLSAMFVSQLPSGQKCPCCFRSGSSQHLKDVELFALVPVGQLGYPCDSRLPYTVIES